MHVYFSGIGGAGLGPLALLARDCGYEVSGSDLHNSTFTQKLHKAGLDIAIGEQDGSHIKTINTAKPIDWFVYTAALPIDHPELAFASDESDIRATKRDEFINEILEDKELHLIAVSGTHGKTTTTAMLIWLFKQFNIPLAYQVGTNLPWGQSAQYVEGAQYFVYEADEYDRNMLHFHPDVTVLTTIAYDHPDTYPTREIYAQAFRDFAEQSEHVITWQSVVKSASLVDIDAIVDDDVDISSIELAGKHNRQNAYLATLAFHHVMNHVPKQDIIPAINHFPGTERRFERIAHNLYSDYAHHPTELSAVVQMASELEKGPVIVYQPHQDKRQREIASEYKDVFAKASKVYWLPTYNPSGRDTENVLTPEELVDKLANPEIAEVAEMNEDLKKKINLHLKNGALVVACSAGTLDTWLRQNFA